MIEEKDQELLKEYDRRSRLEPWTLHPLSIVPKIREFHESKAEIRLLLGGNGTGKTTSGAFEAACFATGYNPLRDETYPAPNEGLAVVLRLKDQGPVMREALFRMLPQIPTRNGASSPGWTYWKQSDTIELKRGVPGAGSVIRIKQQEDGPEAFFGMRPLWIWIDEEKDGTQGEEIFNQLMARRTPGRKLHIFLTMTPEHGFSWTYSRLYDKDSPRLIRGVHVTQVSKYDCTVEKGGYLTLEEVHSEDDPTKWEEFERGSRIMGSYMPVGTNPFFRAQYVLRQMETAPKGKPCGFDERDHLFEDPKSDGRIYRARESGHEYVAAWDPSSGVGGDYSTLVVFDRNDLAEVYHAASNMLPPEDFAMKYVLPACRYFGEAKLAVEVNGGGEMALDTVRSYENLYYRTIFDKSSVTPTQKVGWRTGDETRFRLFDSLNRALVKGKWYPSWDLLRQMSQVVKRPKEGGGFRPDHPQGLHDDHVVAAGIALAIHYEEPIEDWPEMSRLAVRYRREARDYALIP